MNAQIAADPAKVQFGRGDFQQHFAMELRPRDISSILPAQDIKHSKSHIQRHESVAVANADLKADIPLPPHQAWPIGFSRPVK